MIYGTKDERVSISQAWLERVCFPKLYPIDLDRSNIITGEEQLSKIFNNLSGKCIQFFLCLTLIIQSITITPFQTPLP